MSVQQSISYMNIVYVITSGFFIVLMFNVFMLSRPKPRANDAAFYTADEVRQLYNITAPIVLGKVDPNRKYAVFSANAADGTVEFLDFIFLSPLTALAWKRIGFNSIVIVVGRANVWNWKSDPLMRTMVSHLLNLDAVVMFMNVHLVNSFIVNQVDSFFGSSLFKST